MRILKYTLVFLFSTYLIDLFIPLKFPLKVEPLFVSVSDILTNPKKFHGKIVQIRCCEIGPSNYFLFAGIFSVKDCKEEYRIAALSSIRPSCDNCVIVAKVLTIVKIGNFEMIILAKANERALQTFDFP